MLKIEKFVTASPEQWEIIIEGMRNPMNSWGKMDSNYRPILCARCDNCMSYQLERWDDCEECETKKLTDAYDEFMIGPNDHSLMMNLAKNGPVHAKYRRMIPVWVTLTAPLYWWKEFDTYKVGTVANSCSTMHKIQAKEFTLEDFSCEHLLDEESLPPYEERADIDNCEPLAAIDVNGQWCYYTPKTFLSMTCQVLNHFRKLYLKTKDKIYWKQMIQLLPTSYNQKRTIMLSYEVLANIYKSRRNHKLDEWHTLCDWIEGLPYSEMITGERNAK